MHLGARLSAFRCLTEILKRLALCGSTDSMCSFSLPRQFADPSLLQSQDGKPLFRRFARLLSSKKCHVEDWATAGRVDSNLRMCIKSGSRYQDTPTRISRREPISLVPILLQVQMGDVKYIAVSRT